jgi:hypothetical protein
MSSLIMSPLMKIAAGVALLIGFVGASIILSSHSPQDTVVVWNIANNLVGSGAIAITSGTLARHYPGWRGLTIFLYVLGFTFFLLDMLRILYFYLVVLSDRLGHVTIFTITTLLSDVLIIALGLLFGYALLTLLTTRGEQVRLSLVPYQITLGNLAIVLGALIVCLTLWAPVGPT